MDYMTMNFNRNGGSGTSDYSQLSNKPSINNVTLIGNKTSADLGLMPEYEVDTTPTESSDNLITSGGVWNADKNINNKLQGSKTAGSTDGSPFEIPDYGMTESIQMYFKPTQDLHGYDRPWAGGAGKNKLNNASWVAQTINGVTFTPQTDGTILVNGVNDGTADSIYWLIDYSAQITPQEEQILSGLPSEYSGVVYGGNNIGSSSTDVELHQGTSYSIALLVGNSERVDNVTIYPMIRKATESSDFEPYSNICPISGQDNATFSWTDSHDIENEASMDFGQTYYGGFCQFATGAIYSEWDYISGNSVSDLVSAGMSSDTTEAGLYLMYLPSSAVIQANNQAATSDKLVCNELENIAANQGWSENVSGICINEQGSVIFTVKDITTQADMDTWLSNNPIQIAYRKKTPSYVRVTPPANLSLTDDYPIEYNGYMASIGYQPKNTVLAEAKKYTNQEIAKLGLPTPPTTDGTYHLECSVSSGIPTIRWVLNS